MKNKLMKIMEGQTAQFSVGGKSRGWKFYIYAKFVEDEYMPLIGKATFLYIALLKYANHLTRRCYPSYKTLMKKTGIKNKSDISLAVKVLEALRFIEVRRSTGKKPNEYKLLDPDWWMPVNGLAHETVKTVSNQHKKRSQKTAFNGLNGKTRIVSTDPTHINNDLNSKELTNKIRELGDKWRIRP